MSAALDQIEPAAATGSTLAFSMTWTSPSMRKCGEATLPFPARPERAVTVRVMPRGSRMRERTNSSQGMPLTSETTSPAAAYITFWYVKCERRELSWGRYRMRNRMSRGAFSRPYQRKSELGSPARWVSRSRTVTSRVT